MLFNVVSTDVKTERLVGFGNDVVGRRVENERDLFFFFFRGLVIET